MIAPGSGAIVASPTPSPTTPAGRWHQLEFLLAVAGVFLLTLGPLYQVRVRFGGPIQGPDLIDDPFVQQTFVAVYAVALVLLARQLEWWRAQRPLVLALGIFCATVIASTAWSEDRTRTLSQGVLLTGTCVFGLYLGVRHSVRAQARLVFVGLHLGAASAAFAIARSWVGSRDRNGAWTGIYFNRNSLGPVAVIGLLSACWLAVDAIRSWRAGRLRTMVMWCWVASAAVAGLVDLRLEAGARSVTPVLGAMAAAGAVALAMGLAWATRPNRLTARRADVLLAAAGLLVLLVGLFGWRRFSVAIGRSPTLESRTGLWGLVVDTWRERPLLGRGWMAVWTSPSFQEKVKAVANEPLPNAHNGYLEVLLGGGPLGVLALAGVLVVVLARTWRVSVVRDVTAAWPLLVVAYALTVNLMETFVGANLLVWVLLLMAASGAPTSFERGQGSLVHRPGNDAVGGRRWA